MEQGRLEVLFLLKTVKTGKKEQEELRTFGTSGGAGGGVIASLCPLHGLWEGSHRLVVLLISELLMWKLRVTLSVSSVTARLSAGSSSQDGYRVACRVPCWVCGRCTRSVLGGGYTHYCAGTYYPPAVYRLPPAPPPRSLLLLLLDPSCSSFFPVLCFVFPVLCLVFPVLNLRFQALPRC